jgi:hypothetical protein
MASHATTKPGLASLGMRSSRTYAAATTKLGVQEAATLPVAAAFDELALAI